MSVFHQHSHATSKYYSSIIIPPGMEPGFLWWEIGALPKHFRINSFIAEVPIIWKPVH